MLGLKLILVRKRIIWVNLLWTWSHSTCNVLESHQRLFNECQHYPVVLSSQCGEISWDLVRQFKCRLLREKVSQNVNIRKKIKSCPSCNHHSAYWWINPREQRVELPVIWDTTRWVIDGITGLGIWCVERSRPHTLSRNGSINQEQIARR